MTILDTVLRLMILEFDIELEIATDAELSKLVSLDTDGTAVMDALTVLPSKALLRTETVVSIVSLAVVNRLRVLAVRAELVMLSVTVLKSPMIMAGTPVTVEDSLATRASDERRKASMELVIATVAAERRLFKRERRGTDTNTWLNVSVRVTVRTVEIPIAIP
jgi:hypothetical protein